MKISILESFTSLHGSSSWMDEKWKGGVHISGYERGISPFDIGKYNHGGVDDFSRSLGTGSSVGNAAENQPFITG